jgi:hypothetical protein
MMSLDINRRKKCPTLNQLEPTLWRTHEVALVFEIYCFGFGK